MQRFGFGEQSKDSRRQAVGVERRLDGDCSIEGVDKHEAAR
jgi:hypothetical protein